MEVGSVVLQHISAKGRTLTCGHEFIFLDLSLLEPCSLRTASELRRERTDRRRRTVWSRRTPLRRVLPSAAATTLPIANWSQRRLCSPFAFRILNSSPFVRLRGWEWRGASDWAAEASM